ncbi:histidine kinase [Saccharothrix sp. NPDC042600]|uniref:sensor histidine kinase n=1 Tax=Saccharothrix TaxID=2071 RepID=UPI0033EE93CA|nr:hypothetical protein GCM10017745_58680 [Saccharothrix mutabilis subsp. capreolus]
MKKGLVAADAVAAVAVVALAVVQAQRSDPLVWGMAVALGLPVAVRRVRPVAVLAVVVVVGAGAIVVGGGAAVLPAIALALYPVGLRSARAGVVGAVAAVAGVVVAAVVVLTVPGLPLVPVPPGAESFRTTPVAALSTSVVVVAGAWGVAAFVRTRRRHYAELADLRASRAVSDERLRIARDVHDVVGHNLSLIAMRAAVANHLGEDREAALRTIEEVSRAALHDVRTVLGGLRDPVPAGLDGLVADARSAGVAVDASLADLGGTPAAVRVSAYRIVQEALTNVRRHCDPPRCRLETVVGPDRLVVSVVDEGVSAVAGPPGHGLVGMRERAALHGGTLHAGVEPGGGFAVRATLPFERSAP